MPHAQIEGQVTCSAMECVQPGTVLVVLSEKGDFFEYCEYHARRLADEMLTLSDDEPKEAEPEALAGTPAP